VSLLAACFVVSLVPFGAVAQQRPPAVPLVAHDPYFSLWSMNDKLTDGPTRHWTGKPQPLTGLVRVDGKNYRYMGAFPEETPALTQNSVTVAATHTIYKFTGAGIVLTLTFFTPAFPQDMDLLSRPVTYLSWKVTNDDGKPHDVSLLLDASPLLAVNEDNEAVTWGRLRTVSLDELHLGSRDQRVLNRSGDDLRIDWGYFRLCVPRAASVETALVPNAVASFLQKGILPANDDAAMPQTPRDHAAHAAVVFPLGNVGSTPVERHILLSYTEGYAIELMAEMLETAEHEYAELERHGTQYDAELRRDLVGAGGEDYAGLAILAYRQALAAHKLVADWDGTPYLFAKENFSNGDIATVDVLYPSAPFFLFFNPRLLEAQMTPVMNYAASSRWHFPFAPHDLGRYPLADGQEYGGGERTEEDQMPVEESGNLLILAAALDRAESETSPDHHYAEKYWPQLTVWAKYVRAEGLDPASQLSTDDFAGHLAHNANLSIKAIDALGAYATLADALGKHDVEQDYQQAAREMAAKWQTMAKDGDHYKLAFDVPGSWSQKYNLVWDKLLKLDLFPPGVRDTEIAFYLQHLNRYGLPLDSRKDYTKLDWEVWTATLADKPEEFQQFMTPIALWVNESPTRVPLTDWYDTKTGEQEGFQARSVVGGIYVKAYADPALTRKWRAMAGPTK
jgi:Glutaminase A six helical-hairpin domain/Domain of unknown function (DUF5127)/Domain of unknown function (DUF4964)